MQVSADCITPANQPSGPTAAKAAICKETVRLCVGQYGDRLRAIVLTGSFARNEATCVQEQGGWRVLGDAEFLLIFAQRAALPHGVGMLSHSIEDALLQHKVLCHVGLAAVHQDFLRNLRPQIFAYELRTCGEVVWGEPEILSLIPAFSSADIPLEDAWRLLCNRMIEVLEFAPELVNRSKNPSQGLRYRTVKLYLDMATSLLLFSGAYAPTYRERQERLSTLAQSSASGEGWPFPLQTFARAAASCTEWKLSTGDVNSETGWEFWQNAVESARGLWRWELARLTGAESGTSDRELWSRWSELQPFGSRLRGWLYVIRRQGCRSWRDWPRWARQAWQASPRYWIYGAASELLFQLPSLMGRANETKTGSLEWREVAYRLPKRKCGMSEETEFWEFASEIVWNYNEFLVETRA